VAKLLAEHDDLRRSGDSQACSTAPRLQDGDDDPEAGYDDSLPDSAGQDKHVDPSLVNVRPLLGRLTGTLRGPFSVITIVVTTGNQQKKRLRFGPANLDE
jgi:hypothetical protein